MTASANEERKERFRQVHEQTYPDLLRFVERRVPAADAEDIVSTVFLTAWRRFDDMPDDALCLAGNLRALAVVFRALAHRALLAQKLPGAPRVLMLLSYRRDPDRHRALAACPARPIDTS
jgi:hypothetical protein